MNNAFYFILIRKIRLISKFMTSQPDQQTITIYVLSNISRKDNQAMEFGQAIEDKKKYFSSNIMQKMCQG